MTYQNNEVLLIKEISFPDLKLIFDKFNNLISHNEWFSRTLLSVLSTVNLLGGPYKQPIGFRGSGADVLRSYREPSGGGANQLISLCLYTYGIMTDRPVKPIFSSFNARGCIARLPSTKYHIVLF